MFTVPKTPLWNNPLLCAETNEAVLTVPACQHVDLSIQAAGFLMCHSTSIAGTAVHKTVKPDKYKCSFAADPDC